MNEQTLTARVTGAWYLGLAVTGGLGFLLVRPKLFVEGDPAATLANLTDRPGLARLGVVLEMGVVVTQALAAVWFYKLYRSVRPVAGVAVAAFGLVNAVAIVASATFLATATAIADDPAVIGGTDAAATVGLLFLLSTHAWGIGALFFGLWLIPMGWAAVTTGRFPVALGWLLIAGGVGYILSPALNNGLAYPPGALVDGLAFPATVGELWMIGYLLIRGIRADSATTAPAGGTHRSLTTAALS
ncbi:MAG: DUF4386 domain-containing protein [Acidimicrobiales bacterium]